MRNNKQLLLLEEKTEKHLVPSVISEEYSWRSLLSRHCVLEHV